MAKYQEAAPIILSALENGATMLDAAQQAGISKQTLYEWLNTKTDFADAVQRARKDGERNAVARVEATLLKLATGYEYEDVKTEYGSELNQQTGKYEPVIRKQVRIKRNVPPNTEAIKFFLTNRAPADWKNRNEHEIKDLDILKHLHVERIKGNQQGDSLISNSEAEVQA